MADLIFKDESYKIIGACMDLYNEIGNRFTEPVYQATLEILFQEREILYQREVYLPIMFHGKKVEKAYKADFIVYGDIILELKAVSTITEEHRAQVLNYLYLTEKPLALLVNFGSSTISYHRFVNSKRGVLLVNL